jgi:thioredoxin reductase (NADPH)
MVDLLIAGAGPAGLSAAVNATSEGLDTLVIDTAEHVGGQAKYSSRIENYPGFVNGISGQRLMARMEHQAEKFDAEFWLSTAIVKLWLEGELIVARCSNGSTVVARVLLVCCGLEWRKLAVPGAGRLLHKGLYYGAEPQDAERFRGQTVGVVGGANSAVQAALNFAEYGAKKVWVIVRGSKLEASQYLVDALPGHTNIEVLANSEVKELLGMDSLDGLTLTNGGSLGLSALFVFIGAEPRTEWIQELCECDEHGFIKADPVSWSTSQPGVFAAGDVVSGTTKRIVAASGSGGEAVAHIHTYLASTRLG